MVKRPDGTDQLTFNRLPLYRFTEEGAGQLEGDGFVDDFDGTHFEWAAATTGAGSAPSESNTRIARPPTERFGAPRLLFSAGQRSKVAVWWPPRSSAAKRSLRSCARFLDAADRVPAAFLMEGEPGIGKTVLWRAGVELARARHLRVLTAIPATAETRLSFAALADLLEPVLADVLPSLPRPQRRALEIALLLDGPPGPAPDPRAVAFAFLTAVRALARGGPVVVAIDDIQWLDGPSASMVEFAIRRLHNEPVVFLLALRSGEGAAPLGLDRALPEGGLRRLPIGPLSLGALHHLLGERLDLVTSRPKLRRIRELSGGNPLFALELGRAVQRGAIRLEPGEALPGTLAAAVRDRLMLLPQETRTALLAASALSQPTLALVRAAVGGDPEPRLAPALEAHVIELEERPHPLLPPTAGLGRVFRGRQRRAPSAPSPPRGAASRPGGACAPPGAWRGGPR